MLYDADADVSNCGSIEERSQKPTAFMQRDGTYVCTSFLSASNRSSDHMPQGPISPAPSLTIPATGPTTTAASALRYGAESAHYNK